MPDKVLIIGAGLSGLTTAYLLQKKGIPYQILEARERLGGRIHTLYVKGQPPIEMGATWLGKKHQSLSELLRTLHLEVFEQRMGERAIYEPISTSPPQIVQLPPNTDPSFRIQGGSASLIKALETQLDKSAIHIGQIVQSIHKDGTSITITTNKQRFSASVVISTLPPFLLYRSIDLQPALPNNFLQVAQQTHTWMGESIKIALSYATPFWRSSHSSGTIFSNVGPIPEMYDHANVEDSHYALKGFLNGNYYSVSRKERLNLVLNQLRKYYGAQVDDYLSYEECVWAKEPFTYRSYPQHVLPHQNNGHPIFRQAFWEGRLWIAGSETSTTFPGYMDGAVESAMFVANEVEKIWQES